MGRLEAYAARGGRERRERNSARFSSVHDPEMRPAVTFCHSHGNVFRRAIYAGIPPLERPPGPDSSQQSAYRRRRPAPASVNSS